MDQARFDLFPFPIQWFFFFLSLADTDSTSDQYSLTRAEGVRTKNDSWKLLNTLGKHFWLDLHRLCLLTVLIAYSTCTSVWLCYSTSLWMSCYGGNVIACVCLWFCECPDLPLQPWSWSIFVDWQVFVRGIADSWEVSSSPSCPQQAQSSDETEKKIPLLPLFFFVCLYSAGLGAAQIRILWSCWGVFHLFRER